MGSYMLLTELARGGMATVYVGNKHGVAGFERLVAIKCCRPDLRNDERFVTMFLEEARLAARIHHPNVVPTLDVGSADVLYLVMDYVEGGSLKMLLRSANKRSALLPLGVTLRVMLDALAGLHAAHELCGASDEPLSLVHRDVSPQNILVGIDGISRITDFGIAYAASVAVSLPQRHVVGKLSYMAPEQLTGGPATRCIDVFGAGAVLWEALTGRSLFRRGDDSATAHAVVNDDIPAPSSLVPLVPEALDAIVLKALARDPAERFQTAAEFADAIEQLPIRPATSKTVAAYVEDMLGTAIAERRALIRDASGHVELTSPTDRTSEAHSRVMTASGERPIAEPRAVSDESPGPDSASRGEPGSTLPTVATADPMEHARLRNLLAAAMLLLVGSAVGLLLARSGPSSNPAPAASVHAPNHTGSAGSSVRAVGKAASP
jgi:serine/threonine-protein kinase